MPKPFQCELSVSEKNLPVSAFLGVPYQQAYVADRLDTRTDDEVKGGIWQVIDVAVAPGVTPLRTPTQWSPQSSPTVSRPAGALQKSHSRPDPNGRSDRAASYIETWCAASCRAASIDVILTAFCTCIENLSQRVCGTAQAPK